MFELCLDANISLGTGSNVMVFRSWYYMHVTDLAIHSNRYFIDLKSVPFLKRAIRPFPLILFLPSGTIKVPSKGTILEDTAYRLYRQLTDNLGKHITMQSAFSSLCVTNQVLRMFLQQSPTGSQACLLFLLNAIPRCTYLSHPLSPSLSP